MWRLQLRAHVRFVAKQLEKCETIVNISSFSDFRHHWQLINLSEIENLRVSNHVILPIFLTPVHSTLNLKMFPLNCIPKNLYTESTETGQIIRAKSFPLRSNAYPQCIRYGQRDGRTDDRQTTVVPQTLVRQKLCTVQA